MAIALKINIGKFQIQVTGKSEEEVFEQVSFFAELPCECGLCKSKNIVPRHRRTGSGKDLYDFYELVCADCKATFACGQKKEGGLYPRGNKETGGWDEEYKPQDRDERRDTRRDDRDRGRQQEHQPARGRRSDVVDDTDDIPF
jgi:hypothetical protein